MQISVIILYLVQGKVFSDYSILYSDNIVLFIFPHKFQHKYSERFKKLLYMRLKWLTQTQNCTLAIIFDELSYNYEQAVS